MDTRDLGGVPDGATVDCDGLIWVAICRGGKIAAFRPDGKVERLVDMPVRRPSSLTIGGPNLDQLYVTTLQQSYFKEASDEGAGAVFLIEGLGVNGIAEPRYAG